MSANQISIQTARYGRETEQRKVADRRADRRQEKFPTARHVCLLLLLVGAFAVAIVYRDEVQTGIAMTMDKVHGPSGYAKAESKARNRIADISKQAAQRPPVVQVTYK